MRSLRFIFIGIITFVFVTNIVFLRKTVSVLLCGVMGFNPVSSYYLLHDYGKAEAAVPSSRVAASDNARTVQEEEQKQKVAGCFLGVCINIPNIPKIPNGNQPKPTASPQYSDEYQKDFDNFPHQPPITDLTGNWITTAEGFSIDQRGCTAGYTGKLTIDGKEPPKHIFTLTQNHNQLSRPDESISYSTVNSSGSYVTNFQGNISGNSIIFLANSPSISTIDKIIGTVNNTGDTITGNIYCKTAKGSATAQETFTWTRQLIPAIPIIPAIPTPCGDKEIQTNYDPNNTGIISGYHHYEVKTMICSTLLSDCTIDKVFTFMESNAKYIAPVEYSKPVKTCMLSTVNIPVLGEGTILTVVDEKAHSVTNFTRKDHPLHPGKVIRTVVEENKSVIVKTVGDGTGWFPSLNESKATDLWGNIDNQLKHDFNPKVQ